MIRVLFLFHLMLMLFIDMIFNGVTIDLNTPTEVNAGEEFIVSVTVDKSSLNSFARFQQNLPAGLKASAIDPSGGDFSFQDNRIRLIWLRMPDEPSLTITYKISVDPRLTGDFTMGGRFSYIEDNQRKNIEVSPINITIIPSPDIDPALIVDVDEFEQKVIPDLTPESLGEVSAVRQAPYQPVGEDDWIVKVLVNRGNQNKFAKIEENIPAGYTALKMNTENAIFTFKDGVAKFLWMNLPSDPYFIVSYRLVPEDENVAAPPVITGEFSYIEGDKTRVIDIVQKDADLENMDSESLRQLLYDMPVILSENVSKNESPAQGNTTSVPVQENTTPKNTGIPAEAKNIEKQQQRPKPVYSKVTGIPEIHEPYVLQPREGVTYRVQVAAGHRPVNIERYFDKYNLNNDVKTEVHEGWHKYLVGTFSEYKEARDYRVHIWNTTTIEDAFVAAYNSGDRITVQEALMITNQKWYR